MYGFPSELLKGNLTQSIKYVANRLRDAYEKVPASFRYKCSPSNRDPESTLQVAVHYRLGDRASNTMNKKKNHPWSPVYTKPIADAIVAALSMDGSPFTSAEVSIFTELPTFPELDLDVRQNASVTIPPLQKLQQHPGVLDVIHTLDGQTKARLREFPDVVLGIKPNVMPEDGFRFWWQGHTNTSHAQQAAVSAVDRAGLQGQRKDNILSATTQALTHMHVFSDNSPVADLHCMSHADVLFLSDSSFSYIIALQAKGTTVVVPAPDSNDRTGAHLLTQLVNVHRIDNDHLDASHLEKFIPRLWETGR